MLLALSSGALAGGPLPSGLSDLRQIPPLSEIECPATEAEPVDADSPHEIEGLVGGASLNYTQALGNVKAALEGSVSPEAIKALEASPEAKDPGAATRVAVIAMGAQKPLATVAYLVKAHEAAPAEPLPLSNLSGIANYYGLHREALAFARKAESLPKKLSDTWRAVLLTNKGYALNSLGRPEEAEKALAEAIRLSPDLPEAYTNMAFALGDQDKCEQAVRFLRAGMTRRPADVFKSGGKEPERIPLTQVIDMSKGKPGVLPLVPIATEPGEAEAVRRQLDTFKDQTETPVRHFYEQAPQAIQNIMERRMRWAEQGPAGALTADFAEMLHKAFDEYTTEIITFHQTWLGGSEQSYHPDPEIRDLARSAVQAHYKLTRIIMDEDWEPRYQAIFREYNAAMRRCEKSRDPNTCESLAFLKKNTAICLLGKELGAKREKVVRAYDRALRELYSESYRRASALAAYFSDPAHKAYTRLALGGYAAISLDLLVNGGYTTVDMYGRVRDNCEAADYTPLDILFERLKQLAEECKPSGKVKVSASVLDISANCEEIGIGVSTPGAVGLFSEVTYKFSQRFRRITDPQERFLEKQAGRDPDIALKLPGYGGAFDGDLTVSAGGQAKAGGGGAEVGAKAGGYTTFNGNGDIVDSGGKFTVSGSGQAGLGGVKGGVEYENTLAITSRHGGQY